MSMCLEATSTTRGSSQSPDSKLGNGLGRRPNIFAGSLQLAGSIRPRRTGMVVGTPPQSIVTAWSVTYAITSSRRRKIALNASRGRRCRGYLLLRDASLAGWAYSLASSSIGRPRHRSAGDTAHSSPQSSNNGRAWGTVSNTCPQV